VIERGQAGQATAHRSPAQCNRSDPVAAPRRRPPGRCRLPTRTRRPRGGAGSPLPKRRGAADGTGAHERAARTALAQSNIE